MIFQGVYVSRDGLAVANMLLVERNLSGLNVIYRSVEIGVMSSL